MKISLKQAMIAGALVVASTSAFADAILPSTNNGSLVLYVVDATANTSYSRVLDAQMDNVLTSSAIAGGAVNGSTITGFSLGTVGPDANLTAFLSAHSNHSLTWAIVGGAFDGTNGIGGGLGDTRYVTTTTGNITAATQAATNAKLVTVMNQIDGTYSAYTNPALAGGTSTLPTVDAGFLASTANLHDWYGAGAGKVSTFSDIALGSSANFYLLATNGAGNTRAGDYFKLNGVQLMSDGTLVQQQVVTPIPAAIWLLGSGLMGLLGIGRRKNA
jgi:hypothetical protein